MGGAADLIPRIDGARDCHQAAKDQLSEARGMLDGLHLSSTNIMQNSSNMAPLERSAIERLEQDAQIYEQGNFPPDYYETISRHLFEIALNNNGGDRLQAFEELSALSNKGFDERADILGSLPNYQLPSEDFGREFQSRYQELVGNDTENGWDKVRHFTYTAYLQYKYVGLAPEIFTYGKEIMDELEQRRGKDPEGYSLDDIRADNRGEAFAEEQLDGGKRWANLISETLLEVEKANIRIIEKII